MLRRNGIKSALPEWFGVGGGRLGRLREKTTEGIRFRLRSDPGVEEQVRDLATRENACCAFVAFDVTTACTLPTAEQPLREAEFDALFAEAVRQIERPERTGWGQAN
ncbi:hypothetical protein ACIBI9_65455 [Nonomuraea sp. NPDC050451]|uniref:hypothetical protein n=1 Tax=Nonomuraea sp. NPDC050451 TaxID=3364364 RepID=UPI00379338C9